MLGGVWNVRLLLSAATVIACGPGDGPVSWPGYRIESTAANLMCVGSCTIVMVSVEPIAGAAVE